MAWPECYDLSENEVMLDIGGGSGVHSIGAVQSWPNLKAVVLDTPQVCEVADEVIQQHQLRERITTRHFDYWKDPYPPADLHFYSLSYENWPPDRCRFLTEKSFDSLKPGGRILIHEILLNDDKTGPMAAATLNVIMLLWVPGQAYTAGELSQMLEEAGFVDIGVKNTFGYWGVVSGRKP